MIKTPTNKTKYIFLVVIACLLFFAFSKNNEYNNLKEVLVKDKQDLQLELTHIANDYKKLKVKNKKLSKRVIREINKIITLQKSVKELEVENFDLIRSYRKKTAVLLKENKLLIAKVDSLNTVNLQLKQENTIVNETLNEKNILTTQLQKKNKKLLTVNKKLETQVAPAKEIKTSAIKAIAMKEKNSGGLIKTIKHNKTDAFKISFSLLQNNLTNTGNKKIYIQIKDKNNKVIAAKEQLMTLKNNTKIKYSDVLITDYKNKKLDILSLILVNRKNIESGDYTVNIYIDGNYTSGSVITLK